MIVVFRRRLNERIKDAPGFGEGNWDMLDRGEV